jgi:hypothetical protein
MWVPKEVMKGISNPWILEKQLLQRRDFVVNGVEGIMEDSEDIVDNAIEGEFNLLNLTFGGISPNRVRTKEGG